VNPRPAPFLEKIGALVEYSGASSVPSNPQTIPCEIRESEAACRDAFLAGQVVNELWKQWCQSASLADECVDLALLRAQKTQIGRRRKADADPFLPLPSR
jgi:hypothetical protein